MAPGSGTLSNFAFKTIAKVNPPPAEVPKIATFFGLVVFNTDFQTFKL